VRGPQCDSCESRNPGSFGCAPWSTSRVSGSPGFFAPPPVSLPHKRQPRTTQDSLGPASYPAALKQAPSSLHCSSRRSVPSAASFGYTVPLRRTGHGRCSAHGSAGFFRAVWINQETMCRRPVEGSADFFDHFASTSRRCGVGPWERKRRFFRPFRINEQTMWRRPVEGSADFFRPF
jgi:hypothetical protein